MTHKSAILIGLFICYSSLAMHLDCSTYGFYAGIYSAGLKNHGKHDVILNDSGYKVDLSAGAVLKDGAQFYQGTKFSSATLIDNINGHTDSSASALKIALTQAKSHSNTLNSSGIIPAFNFESGSTAGITGASAGDQYTLQAGESITIPWPDATTLDANIESAAGTAMSVTDIQKVKSSTNTFLDKNPDFNYEGGFNIGTTYKNMQFEFAASKNNIKYFNGQNKVINIDNFDFLINSYGIIDLKYLIPYVGIGLGLEYASINYDSSNYASGSVSGRVPVNIFDKLDSANTFIYQLIAGTNIALTKNCAIYVDYKYKSHFSSEGIEFNPKDDADDVKLNIKNNLHVISVGIKYLF